MTTLALGVAGAAIGSFFGPIGASIGWTLGSALGSLLDPKKVEGPRLSDRKLHNSSYGEMVTIICGTMRAAGNVFWIGNNQELVEHKHTEGGKGGPEVTTYTYSASFAIGLCEGVMSRVGRIWADNKLIYDITSTDAPGALPCTFYAGDDTQLPDPRMASEDGEENTPAYRGTCYVVFEDMDLADYGNRIPSLSFEVEQSAIGSAQMRVVASNYDRVQAWTEPQITDWTLGADQIRIAEVGPNREFAGPGVVPLHVKLFDEDLIDQGVTPTLPTDAFPYNFWISPGGFPFVGVGMYVMNAENYPIWRRGGVPVNPSNIDPALCTSDIYSDGAHVYGPDIAYGFGVPAGFNIDSCCLSMSRDVLFVMGSMEPSGVDTWYRIGNGQVIATGTCELDTSSLDGIPLSLEDNWRWLWAHQYNTGYARIYHIDDDNVLRIQSAVGSVLINPAAGGVGAASMRVIAEGYCAVVTSIGDIAVLTRFPFGATNEVPLSDVVLQFARMVGYDDSEIDVTDLADDRIAGYMIASQMSGRDALLPLQSAWFFDFPESGGVMKAVKRGKVAAATIPDDELAAHTGDGELPPLQEIERLHEEELPATLNLVYVNPEIDYQNTTQVERRQVTRSTLETTIQLAISMSHTRAKQVSQATVFAAWYERNQFKWTTSSRYAYLDPSDIVNIRGYRLRITQKHDGADDVISYEGVQDFRSLWVQGGAPQYGTGIRSTTGRTVQSTVYELLDVPLLHDEDDQFGFRLAMAGAVDDTWRGGVLYKSVDGGASYASVASDSTGDPIGVSSSVLGDYFGGNTFDELNTVTVFLTESGSDLESVNVAAVLNGANTALLGSEVLQFKNADVTGPREYRLSGLLRGRLGTEFATAGHTVGERFVLLDRTTVVSAPLGDLNQPRKYKGVTAGGLLASATARDFTNTGSALRPYAPVHLGGGADASGNAVLQWTRRTRKGGIWLDFVEVALGEDAEKYVVEIWDASYTICARTTPVTAATSLIYTAAQQVADFGGVQSSIYFTVRQVGTYMLGSRARGVVAAPAGTTDLPITPTPPYGNPPGPPPGPSNPVNKVLSWHSDTHTTTGFKIGDTYIVSFTTDGSPSSATELTTEPAGGDPGCMRFATLALDTGGTQVVATAQGVTTTFPFSPGFLALAPFTTYYVLYKNVFSNGSPSGPLGTSVNMRITLS